MKTAEAVGVVNDWQVRSRSFLVRKNGKYLQMRILRDGATLKPTMTEQELDAITTSKLICQTVTELRPVRTAAELL
jgi:hypothetical protein